MWEIIQTLQTSRYNRSRKTTCSKYNILQLLPCLAQHPPAFTSRCPTDKEGEGPWSRPPKTFTCFIRSSPADVKQNKKHSSSADVKQNQKRSSPADVEQNKRSRVCHRKIQNISNYRLEINDANFVDHQGAADVKIQPKFPKFLLDMHYFCNFSLVSLGIRLRSSRGAERVWQGEGHLSRPPKTGLERSYLVKIFSPANRILRPRRKKLQTESPKKRMTIYSSL